MKTSVIISNQPSWNHEGFLSAWGTEKIARLWFTRGISTQAGTMVLNLLNLEFGLGDL